ncbi:hypothetical protein ABTZ44_01310 [Microbacterium oxydans]|uniref:hypothetical protein n=1 Tax=Microbacterium TaxID=33882 RepID=UPI00187D31C7|nr:hypothetical protein [Microbacterium sp. R1]MBE7954751.1 hypothetical protein [Microbacterium sp. R1]
MNKSLTRSIGFWLLLVVSLATTAVGAWLISGQIATMTTTLLDGTATGVEVYVGQSLVVVGAGVLAAGIVGILLTLGLVAARALVASPAPAVVEAIDWTAAPDETHAPVTDTASTVTDTAADADAGSDAAAAPAAALDDAPAKDANSDDSPSITR